MQTDDSRVPLSRMRRAIGDAMTLSAQIPQFTLYRTVAARVIADRRTVMSQRGQRVSLTDMIIEAAAAALRAHPQVNGSFADDAIVLHGSVNIGLAIALADGIINPVIRDADALDVDRLSAERRRLTELALSSSLRANDIDGATFTVSNLGPFGIEAFRALVIPPQAAILAIGALVERGGGPEIGISLSCDHRVVDGRPAAEFLATMVDRLEDNEAR
jgi:pyruvate dehydrogenase E2 component (dihydrolipoamide acetyltransferase)